MTVFKLILFTLFISGSHSRHPDKVYCVDEKCAGPISKAKTLITYNSGDPDLISFRANSEALVYMKSAGTNSDLWFVKINGKSGFANSRFLREYKVIEKNAQTIIPYETKAPVTTLQPDKVQQPHEVFEGTTIYTTEAAVSNEQQDLTTESPVASVNEDLTPSLDNSDKTLNENIQNEDDNVAQKGSPNLESPSEEVINVDVSPTTEVPEQTEAIITDINKNESVEPPIETIPSSTEDIDIDKEYEQQADQQLPKELPIETSAQQFVSRSSETFNTDPLLEVPDNKEFNSLTDSEQTDKEQNSSATNNNVENVQLDQDLSNELNTPNGEINPVNTPVDDQTQPSVSDNLADTVQVEDPVSTDPVNTNDVQTNDVIEQESTSTGLHDPQLEAISPVSETAPVQPEIPPVLEPIQPEIPAFLEPIPSVPPTREPIPSVPSLLEPIPAVPPVLDTIPPAPPIYDTLLPVTTETIPAFYPPISVTPTPETIPPILNNIEQPLPEVPSETYTTTPSPYYTTEETTYPETIPDSTPTPEQDTPQGNTETSFEHKQEELSTTEVPVSEENKDNFFSNIYSSVADMLPSSTEAPPIYKTEEHLTSKNEKAEENEGFSYMKYFMSMYYSVMGTSEESKALFAAVGETCYTDEYCDGTSNDGSNRLLTFLLTTASSVLLFTLGYYYIDNRRQDGRLIGQINSLQRDLLFTTKECEILKEELSTTKNKLAGIEDSSFGMDDMVQSLKEEINELKATNDRLRNSLDDNEKLLRVSENTAGELQNTLSELENTLSELLAERANSEEQIVELNGKIQAFEEELISVSRDRDNFQLKYVSAESALEEFKKQKKQLEDVNQQLTEAKNTLELQKHEIVALKDAIKEIKNGMPSNVDVSSLIDHTEIKAKLSKALEEKKSLETKYEAEHKEKSRLAEELQTTQETLHTTSQNANEALTRLDVLGKYFQERESELMKELSAKESLWLSKQGESASTVEKIELLQQEIQRYKEKCDALTLELAEQESSRRSALSALEARAHAAWLEARGARRDADAARDDAAALRRKLASLSSIADGAVSPHHKVVSPLDNVENSVLPPPLPPMFLPPPLLPPLPRPPPLGRLPSPHPPRYGERRYTPDSRYSPESRYSPDSRYSPETVRYSPDSRYSPRSRRSAYSPRSRRRSRSRERYEETRPTRSRNNGPADTETEYNSDSPSREPRRRRYSRHSGPSSGSGCSSESDK